MSAVEEAIAIMVSTQVAAMEKRIMERFSVASDKTLSFAEACEHLNMSEYTLRPLCKKKLIPHRVVGAEGSKSPRYVFSSISLDKWKREEEEKNYIRNN